MSKHRAFQLTAPLAVVLTMALAGCGADGLFGSNAGRVRFVLSGNSGDAGAAADVAASADAGTVAAHRGGNGQDWPSWWFQSANVTFSSVLARNASGVLINVDMDLPVTVDVVEIENGKVVQLPDGVLPAGMYDQVVVVMTAVQGVTQGGTSITIEPSGGGWTAVIPICPLEVAEGETTPVGIELVVRNSLRWNGQRFFFEPRFRPAALDCDEDEG